MTTRKPPGNYVCPLCAAGVGQRCLTMSPSSPPRETNYHVARKHLAARMDNHSARADLDDAWQGFVKALTDLGQRTRKAAPTTFSHRWASISLISLGCFALVGGLLWAVFISEPHSGDYSPFWVVLGGAVLAGAGVLWNAWASDWEGW